MSNRILRAAVNLCIYFLLGAFLAALLSAAEVLTISAFPLEGKQVARAECTLGNLVADAVRNAAEGDSFGSAQDKPSAPLPSASLRVNGTSIALLNASQIRPTDLPAGPLTDEQVLSVLAYPDEPLALVRLKGSAVLACLERGLGLIPQPNKGFLQISALSARFDSRRPAGKRVIEVKVAGKPLELEKEYKVAMPLSLAKGAGGYFTILNGVPTKSLEITLLAAVKSYLRSQGTASAKSTPPRLEDLGRPLSEGK